jgi:hypothetical protein
VQQDVSFAYAASLAEETEVAGRIHETEWPLWSQQALASSPNQDAPQRRARGLNAGISPDKQPTAVIKT